METIMEQSKSKSKRAYLIYLTVCLSLVAGILLAFWVKLTSYQNGIDLEAAAVAEESLESAEDGPSIDTAEDERNAQQAFEDYINSLSVEEWCVLYRQSHPASIDSNEAIAGLVNERILPAITSKYRAADYSASSPRFIIGSEEEAVASFILSKSGNNWAVTDTKILIGGSNAVSLTIAKGCELSSGSDILNQIEPSTALASVDDYAEDLVEPSVLCTYDFTDCISEEASFDFANAYHACDGVYYLTEEDTSDFISKSESFVKALLNCYAQGKTNYQANISATLGHVDSSSSAAKVIRETESGLEWTPPDSSISFNLTDSPVCILADNCRFVEVTCESGSVYRIFFLDRGNGYKIVQFYCL